LAGNGRRPGRAACSGELDGVIESREEVVWGGAGDGVSLFRKERRLFIDGRGSTEVSSGGQLTAWAGKGVKRGRLWRVLRAAACCRRVLARWEGSGRSGSKGDKEGVRVGFPLFFHVSRPWVGAGEAGDRHRGERGCPRVRLGRLGRPAVASSTVSLVFRISAQIVFDEMPARSKNSNF
jgi:hypothetical protein